jgi:hypothetical protein
VTRRKIDGIHLAVAATPREGSDPSSSTPIHWPRVESIVESCGSGVTDTQISKKNIIERIPITCCWTMVSSSPASSSSDKSDDSMIRVWSALEEENGSGMGYGVLCPNDLWSRQQSVSVGGSRRPRPCW